MTDQTELVLVKVGTVSCSPFQPGDNCWQIAESHRASWTCWEHAIFYKSVEDTGEKSVVQAVLPLGLCSW